MQSYLGIVKEVATSACTLLACAALTARPVRVRLSVFCSFFVIWKMDDAACGVIAFSAVLVSVCSWDCPEFEL